MLSFQAGHTILFTRKTMVSAHKSIIPEFVNMIEMLGMTDMFEVTKDQVINKKSQSTIWFMGLTSASGDNTAKVKSLAGITTWVLDEAEELTEEDLFDKVDLSIRTQSHQNRVILAMNPTTKEHWVYDRFFMQNGILDQKQEFSESANDCTVIHTTYLSNAENLNDSFINQAQRMLKTAPEQYERVFLGGWRDRAEGVVFTNWTTMDPNWEWDDERGIFDPLDVNQLTRTKWHDEVFFGQDYGYSPDATTLVKIGIDKYNKKIYVHECFYKTELETPAIIRENLKHAGPKNIIVADHSEPRLINEVSKYCNMQPCKKGPDSIVAGIKAIQDYELVVTPDSYNLIKELSNYTWDEKKIDKPIDKWNHCIDGLRYAVMFALLDSYSNDLTIF